MSPSDTWARADEYRARYLREITRKRELTSDERNELSALRRRETIEAFRIRRAIAARKENA